MVRPSSRGGVPVFSGRAQSRRAPACVDSPMRRRLADAAGRNLRLADMDQAAQKRAGGQNHRAGSEISRPSANLTPETRPFVDDQIVGLGFDHLKIRRRANRGLHRGRIELAIGLRARTAHGRAFAAIENAELDAAVVGDAAHQAVQCIDFADQMALAEPADRRIAGHRADGRESVRHQGRVRAHARGRGRGFAAGVAAADDDDVEYSRQMRLVSSLGCAF